MKSSCLIQLVVPLMWYGDFAWSKTVDDYLNICLDGKNHKSVPGPEASLFQQCSPWKNKACCTSQTTQDMQLSKNWLNFDWDHCQELSPKCQARFMQDLCFYECSPNVGPWLVEDKRKIRNEKFVNVPLCKAECDDWWNACKDDMTCLPNWSKGFNWSSGINKCPNDKPCQPFHQIYNDSTHFCEAIWGQSFKVVEQGTPCMYLWFDADEGNPNDEVAKQRAEQLVNSSPSLQYVTVLQVLFCSLVAFNLFLSSKF